MIQIVGCKKQNIFMVRDVNWEGKSKRKKNNKKHWSANSGLTDGMFDCQPDKVFLFEVWYTSEIQKKVSNSCRGRSFLLSFYLFFLILKRGFK